MPSAPFLRAMHAKKVVVVNRLRKDAALRSVPPPPGSQARRGRTPLQLRELVRQCIEQHVDPHALEVTKIIEANERDGLMKMAEMQRRKAKK